MKRWISLFLHYIIRIIHGYSLLVCRSLILFFFFISLLWKKKLGEKSEIRSVPLSRIVIVCVWGSNTKAKKRISEVKSLFITFVLPAPTKARRFFLFYSNFFFSKRFSSWMWCETHKNNTLCTKSSSAQPWLRIYIATNNTRFTTLKYLPIFFSPHEILSFSHKKWCESRKSKKRNCSYCCRLRCRTDNAFLIFTSHRVRRWLFIIVDVFFSYTNIVFIVCKR